MQRILLILILTSLTILPASPQNNFFKLKNLISTRGSLNFEDPVQYNFGAQYIPTINLSGDLKKGRSIDAEVSVNGSLNYYFTGNDMDEKESDLEPYRAWIRYTSPGFEIRAGLQKINFGSASILRPLMWFDKMDYRDPLQLTPGVYSLLARYYFQNNINIWLWALYGNTETKGWEIAPTKEKEVEYGGRLQIPLPGGELGMSYHNRVADYTDLYILNPQLTDPFYSENMLGLDGKWDIGPGISFEYVYKLNDPDNILLEKEEQYLNIGIDYTFGLGNGLNVIAEYFRYKGTNTDNYAAMAINYPFGLMNSVLLAVYYNTGEEDIYSLITLKRDYNYLSLNFMAYWNPLESNLYGTPDGKNLLAGKGFQVLAVVNF